MFCVNLHKKVLRPEKVLVQNTERTGFASVTDLDKG